MFNPQDKAKHRRAALFPAILMALGMAATAAYAQDPAPAADDDAKLSGGRPDIMAPPPHKKIYQQKCAMCHTDAGLEMGGRVVPTTATLKAMQASKVYDAMAN